MYDAIKTCNRILDELKKMHLGTSFIGEFDFFFKTGDKQEVPEEIVEIVTTIKREFTDEQINNALKLFDLIECNRVN